VSKIMKIVTISVIAALLAPTIVLAMPVDVINPGVGEPGPDPWPKTGSGGDSVKDEPNPFPKGDGTGLDINWPIDDPDPWPPGDGPGSIPVESPDPAIGEGGLSIPVDDIDPWPRGDGEGSDRDTTTEEGYDWNPSSDHPDVPSDDPDPWPSGGGEG
jgi:hypothetical protein